MNTVAAGEVRVAGLRAGAAGSRRLGRSWLSSIAGLFTVSPDLARVLPPAPVSVGLAAVRRYVPPRPASETEFEMYAAAE
jgi:hypothetical protein